jgi:predicted nucleic acid-binding protein
MRFRAILDSDGLIKLAKAGVLEVVFTAWSCLIPRAVYGETVERGMRGAYPDAATIRDAVRPRMIRLPVRHPQATRLLGSRPGLGQGEREALHLFFAAKADAIISDDVAFVSTLDRAGLPYLPPALVIVRLARERHLGLDAALQALDKLQPLIRQDVYRAARADLETFQSGPSTAPEGGSLP